MCGFERRNNALGLHQQAEGLGDFVVGGGIGSHPTLLRQVGQDRGHTDVIEAGGDTVRVAELAVVVLQEQRLVTLCDAGFAGVLR